MIELNWNRSVGKEFSGLWVTRIYSWSVRFFTSNYQPKSWTITRTTCWHDLIDGSTEIRRRRWHPTPVLLPGKFHGWRSLVGCSPWGHEESDMTERLHFHFHALEKEMATHSIVLAWRIPGMGQPDGLPSVGSHRVGHDWSDLAAAAALRSPHSRQIRSLLYPLLLLLLSRFSHVWLFAILWTEARQAPLSMGFFRQEYQSGLPCPPPGNLPNPGIEPTSLTSPALASRFFTTRAHLGSPLLYPHPDEIMRNLDSQVIKVNARIKSIRSGTSYFLLKHKHHHFFLVLPQEVEFKRNASEPGFTQWFCVINKVIMGLNDSYFILFHAIYKFSMTISNIFQCLTYELMRFFSFFLLFLSFLCFLPFSLLSFTETYMISNC